MDNTTHTKHGLTEAQREEVRQAAAQPIVYDEDAPPLSKELEEAYINKDPKVFVR